MKNSAAKLEIYGSFEKLRAAGEVIQLESDGLARLAKQLPVGLSEAVDLVVECKGSIIVTGIGKAGWIGQKISATLASTGSRSHFMHPAEAIHGDLGRLAPDDVVLALSNSGETEEVLQILPAIQKLGVPLIAITGQGNSTLAHAATAVLDYGRVTEACHLGLAPSTSTTLMLALGDAVAIVASQIKKFQPTDFAKFHPGGALGRRLSTVRDLMRPIEKCRVAKTNERVRDVYVRSSVAERRVGVILIVDDSRTLAGIFTDSDLARLLEKHREQMLDQPISRVMTPTPICIRDDRSAIEAVELLAQRNISELPVVDESNRPLGIVDITDVIGLLPVQAA